MHTRLGRFEVVERIGSGGMGTVYKALDPELGRAVAIKVLSDAGVGGTDAEVSRARLRREAQAMARLAHPNVVPVHEIGSGEPLFIVMELVAGGTVRDWLREPRSVAEILSVFEQAGRGLAAAHEAGLVHRDFKPENILRGTDGRVRVVDFGLVASGEQAPRTETDEVPVAVDLGSALTMTGIALGTPAYMAPEQHRREATDARTDQFSFAVACYEALYGERPFAGTTYRELVKNVYAGAVRAAPPDREVPAQVRAALVRALSVDPAERFPAMTDLLAELMPVALPRAASEPAPVAAPRRRGRVAAVAAIGAILAGTALVIASPWRTSSAADAPASVGPATPPAPSSEPAPSPSVPVVAPASVPAPAAGSPVTPEPVAVPPRAAKSAAVRTTSRPAAAPPRESPPPPVTAGSGSAGSDDAADRRRRQLELVE